MQLLLVSSLIGLSVTHNKDKKKLGTIHTVLFDTDNGSVIGFVIKLNILTPTHFLDLDDIESIDKHGVYIKDTDVLAPIKEVIRAHEIYKKGFRLVGMKVKTESGKKIGRVNDIAISLTHGILSSLYIGGFLQDRIIPREKIIDISMKAIIISDDAAEAKLLPDLEIV